MNKQSVKINPTLLKAVKIYAAEHDCSITDFIEEAITKALEKTRQVVK